MRNQDERYASQNGRGRNADYPSEISAGGWGDVLWRLFKGVTNDRLLLTSAGVTFYVLLALVPTLTAFVSLYGLFNDRASVTSQLQLLDGLIPPGAMEIIGDQLGRLATESGNTLGVTLIVSLCIALWSASAGVKAMFKAMNVAYGEREKRPFLVLNGVALLFTLGGAFAAVLVVTVALVVPALVSYLPGSQGLQWTVRAIAFIAMAIALFGALSVLYRWGPSREQAKWRWIVPGTVVAVVALCGSSVLFSWYASNFTDYGAAYGSLGAVIALMTWLWLSITLIVVGAEINSEIEHQTAQDTTTGPEQPLGERGAYMADHVGRVWPLARDKVETGPKTEHRLGKISPKRLILLLPAVLLSRFSRKNRS